MWTAGTVIEVVGCCKFGELIRIELWTIVTPNFFWNTMSGENGLQNGDDTVGGGRGQLGNFWVSRVVVDDQEVDSFV